MTKRMLIDASHQEETRVVVASNDKVSEFDYEIEDRKPLKGNIYLAKVTRVEPSLQAAFVEYGGNRHGFLPFSEIHPDYYRLPIADRDALIAEERAAQRAGEAEADAEGGNGEPDAVAEAAAAGAKSRSGEEVEQVAGDPGVEQVETANAVETLADDDVEDAARRRAATLGRYKIQEVIKRRQVMLVQVVKEERGNKGAALTTYLSLAGRYCVLMPNTDKGGGISRKIANTKDRRRLKTILSELNIPEGMAVIVRTAGSNRTKVEIKRDYEYLLRLWDHIRETTLQSTAPSLIYEEANLIKRSIRDLYTRDMDEVLVQGETGYKAAKSFMRSLMPSHAKKVQRYDDPRLPIFNRYQIETQLDNIHSPSVQLKSGGYVVLNQTEALVAIDVNSGKSTKERHIEETALKTNLEAADEIARQLRLRDLAGLIVIDFIDMDNPKNNKEVEQRLKEAMKEDRARIQLGRISPFGLLELSRQRLRASVHETSTEVCHHCGGSGYVRSPESTGLHVLRALEEEGVKRGGGELRLTLPPTIALHVLNEKRARLAEIEARYRYHVRVEMDDSLIPPAYRLDRLSTVPVEAEVAEEPGATETVADEAEDALDEAREAEPAEAPKPAAASADGAAQSEDASGRKRGRRGGRRKKRASGDGEAQEVRATAEAAADAALAETTVARDTESEAPALDHDADQLEAESDGTETAEAGRESAEGGDGETAAQKRRRRGKRGGRRRAKRREDGTEIATHEDGGDEVDVATESFAESVTEAAPASERTEPETATGAAHTEDESAAAESETDSEASPAPRQRGGKSPRRAGRGRSTIAKAAEATAETGAAMARARRDTEAGETPEPAPDSAEVPHPAWTNGQDGAVRGNPADEATPDAAVAADQEPASAPAEGAPAGGAPAVTAAETPAPAPQATQTTAHDAPAPAPGTGNGAATTTEAAEESAAESTANVEPARPPVETPFGEAAEPSGRDDLGETARPEAPHKRKGWWQKLLS